MLVKYDCERGFHSFSTNSLYRTNQYDLLKVHHFYEKSEFSTEIIQRSNLLLITVFKQCHLLYVLLAPLLVRPLIEGWH